MTALIRAYAGTVVVAGLIAGAWGAVVVLWLWRTVDDATTWGAP